MRPPSCARAPSPQHAAAPVPRRAAPARRTAPGRSLRAGGEPSCAGATLCTRSSDGRALVYAGCESRVRTLPRTVFFLRASKRTGMLRALLLQNFDVSTAPPLLSAFRDAHPRARAVQFRARLAPATARPMRCPYSMTCTFTDCAVGSRDGRDGPGSISPCHKRACNAAVWGWRLRLRCFCASALETLGRLPRLSYTAVWTRFDSALPSYGRLAPCALLPVQLHRDFNTVLIVPPGLVHWTEYVQRTKYYNWLL